MLILTNKYAKINVKIYIYHCKIGQEKIWNRNLSKI